MGSEINEKKKNFYEEREKFHLDNFNFQNLNLWHDFIRSSFKKTKSDSDFIKNINFFFKRIIDFKIIRKNSKIPKMNIFVNSNLIC